ncbi:MAG: 30S ribosomal protein S20 [bacterium]
MPTTTSSQKRVRQNEKRRRQNRSWKTKVKKNIQAVDEAIENGVDEDELEELKRQAISSIDRAVSKDVYHKNKGGRLKSTLQTKVNDYLEEDEE